jgi:hypothetical protein
MGETRERPQTLFIVVQLIESLTEPLNEQVKGEGEPIVQVLRRVFLTSK